MITFNHCASLVRQLAGFLAICNPTNPAAHNYWPPIGAETDETRDELRRRVRALFAVPTDVLRHDERARLVREYAEANL